MRDPEQNSPPPQEYGGQVPPPPTYGMPMTPQRPTVATVIGIILIVLWGLSVLSVLMLVGQLFLLPAMGVDHPAVRQQQIIALITAPLSATLYLVLGIGLLRMAPWARKGVVYLLPALLVVSTLIGLYNVLNMPYGAMATGGDPGFLRMVTMASFVFGVVFNLVMYGLFIYFLTRPQVVEAFEKR